MKVAILGSCVTRDAFGYHPEHLERPENYFARSALASAMCEVPFEGVDTSTIASDFQRSVVDLDLAGTFASWLETADFDVLILDGIDERFALLVDPAGAIATRSSEFTSATADTSGCTVVAPSSEAYYDLWESAWERFVTTTDAAGTRDRVRVNQVYWASDFDRPGAEFAASYSPALIERSNRFLERIYERMARDLGPGQFYRYAEDELRAATEHQWGLAPFHYTPAYYRRFVHHVTGAVVPAPRRSLRDRLKRR